ncbi:helix-turn-helix transcriptional regulator [Clostridium botulinum]|nr:helix-turn-helix transcriptional regulator [Clostridium botulinum]
MNLEKKKITQEKLANKFFLTKSAISKYENGVNTPENKLLQNMADYFDVSTDYLLGRTNKKDKIKYRKDDDILLSLYKNLSDYNKAQLISYAEFLNWKG